MTIKSISNMSKVYVIMRRVANGGVENVKTVNSKAYASGYCHSMNENYMKFGSPNRMFFEEQQS